MRCLRVLFVALALTALAGAVRITRTKNHFTGAVVCTIHMSEIDQDTETRGGIKALDRIVAAQGKTHTVKSMARNLANPGGNTGKKRAAVIAQLRTLVTNNNCVEVIVLGHTNVNHEMHTDFSGAVNNNGVNTPLTDIYNDLRTIGTVTKIHFLACFCDVVDGGHGKLGICANSIVTPGCNTANDQEGWLVLPMIVPFNFGFYQAHYEPIFKYYAVYNGNCKAYAAKTAQHFAAMTAAGGAAAGATHVDFISINAGVIAQAQMI